MEKVRLGIIGVGNMGTEHCKYLHEGKVPNVELTAVCDINPNKIENIKKLLNDKVSYFDNVDALFDSKTVDAVLVATPHYDHPNIGIKALEKGLHLLIEKPAGVYTKQVRELNDIALKTDRVFGIMYNQRTNPLYQKVKDLIDSGELGELRRSIWIITNWYRSQSYYNSGGWRATWGGEGGGVLLNQDPHQLDLWQWICGMPKRVRAFCYYGKYRDIEVEDDVTAYAEYENGATGLFVTTTGEAPGTNRLEITGDKGKIVLEDDKLTFWRLRVPESQFNKEYTGGFGQPECWKCEIPVTGGSRGHADITKNFADAILHGTPLLAPGIEGIRGLSISNAMHLSSFTDAWAELPLNEDLYYELLQEKIKNSRFKKEVKEVNLNVNGTF
jgi:predicted dehydrogenase